MTPANYLHRDDRAAKQAANARGVVVPPLYEMISTPLGIEARQMFMGWTVLTIGTNEHRGYVILVSSSDGEDWEIMAEGGWCPDGAGDLFRFIFIESGQSRVSARCKADNRRNIAVLKRMGFREEGRKRLPDGDMILLGMMCDECRMLNRRSA